MKREKTIKCGSDITIEMSYESANDSPTYSPNMNIWVKDNGEHSYEMEEILLAILAEEKEPGNGIARTIAETLNRLFPSDPPHTFPPDYLQIGHPKDHPIMIDIYRGNVSDLFLEKFPDAFANDIETYMAAAGRTLVEQVTGHIPSEDVIAGPARSKVSVRPHRNDIDIDPVERAERFAIELRGNPLFVRVSQAGLAVFMRNQLNHTSDTAEQRRERAEAFLRERGVAGEEAIGLLVSATSEFIHAERTMGRSRT